MNRSHQTRANDTPDRQGQKPRGARPDLQSQAGNRAVAGLLQPRSVQRFGVTDVLLGPLAGAAAGSAVSNDPVATDVNGVNPIVQGVEESLDDLPFFGDFFGGGTKGSKGPAKNAPPAKPPPAPAPPTPAPPAPAPMPYPTAIDGIPGESMDDKHKDWIEILDFDHSLSTGP
jgi:hypothetical protein